MRNFFANLKIRQKLILSFAVLVIFTTILGALSIYEQKVVVNELEYLILNKIEPIQKTIDIRNSYMDVNTSVMETVIYAQNNDTIKLKNIENEYRENLEEMLAYVDDYVNYIKSSEDIKLDTSLTTNLLDLFNNQYIPQVEKIMAYAEAGNYNMAISLLEDSYEVSDKIQAAMDDFITLEISTATHRLESLDKNIIRTVKITFVICCIIVLLSLVISIGVSNYLSNKIKTIAKAITGVSRGDFSSRVAFDTSDEIGILSRDLDSCIDTIEKIVADTKELGVQQNAGNIDYAIDAEKYSGEYKEMITTINGSFATLISEVMDFLGVIKAFGEGDFEKDIERLNGEKAAINDSIDNLRNNLKSVEKEINTVVGEASKGNLSVRANSDDYEGDWSLLLDGLNNLMTTIANPINESKEVLIELSNGNLEARLEGDYEGEFATIKDVINISMETFGGYIRTIDSTLESINHNDLTSSIDEDFVGDFNNLKLAINNIIYKLNEVFKEFLVGADEVAIGAQQISNSSISLADGASEQVNSLNSLTLGVQKVNQSSSENAKNAIKANEISEVSKQNAVKGDEQMKQMLVSMNEISESSNEISNIIKVIEDIAFQTNLLALNAAVEAARAGVHGKGFAVVADEVRTLAARSSQAAKETTELIQTSISRVAFGSELAKSTAVALDEIVKNVTDVASIIEEISDSSKEQAKMVDEINEEISIVENVVLKTSSASEQGVSTAEELSSQSTVLRDLLGTFDLIQ